MSAAEHSPMATLRFFADDLKPSIVTEVLQIKPTAAAVKGQPFRKKDGGRSAQAREGTWFVTTEEQDLGDKPEDHLRWVLVLAINHLDELKRQTPDVKVDFSLLVFGKQFDLQDIPRDLLRIAVLLGELEVEVPERGVDMFLNRRNLLGRLRREGTAKPNRH